MANPSACLSSVTSDVRAPTQEFNILGDIFAPYCSLAIRQLTHQKSRRSSKGIILGALNAMVGKVAISDQHLAIAV